MLVSNVANAGNVIWPVIANRDTGVRGSLNRVLTSAHGPKDSFGCGQTLYLLSRLYESVRGPSRQRFYLPEQAPMVLGATGSIVDSVNFEWTSPFGIWFVTQINRAIMLKYFDVERQILRQMFTHIVHKSQ
jgi:hypothetical protein